MYSVHGYFFGGGENVNDIPSSVCLSCSNLYILMYIILILEKMSKEIIINESKLFEK